MDSVMKDKFNDKLQGANGLMSLVDFSLNLFNYFKTCEVLKSAIPLIIHQSSLKLL